ncbi:glycerol-3-phosphate dehydrogenase (NAD(P)+) [Aliiroseovarius halocynthiae]|uniref:Glycerol-3-phosphate dehydrogenase [NAD(P)+] n=1 Tax=Aliiroseovarius halocynthiae TaxID=985055 RepID=A0A545SNL4_9RHOB|nr:NAD(P)H-dependent glycerol-3-phosphate dehydrogenase [Aliiroseovarius halocynthiae]TQV66544.1 NAD(P)-dependent glycerol-3-phosphate dehydrogenase [Aliiroseovarius halocynthiae]SMR82588.1 glycerol-3-phosphate dehydrogenase (NAD(P)+) [Aliiroseovarius halocynthiae]
MSISVLGAGAFGTALAISLAQDGRAVSLWARDPGDMATARENTRRLPGFPFPNSLIVLDRIEDVETSQIVLLAVPMQKLAAFLAQHAALFQNKTLVACCKGIDLQSGRGPAEIIRQTCPTATPAILSGPSFAVDIAAGLPTALTLACEDGEALQAALSTKNIRLYRTADLTGVEIGGALKNVVAIACGIAIGAGLGESARAALMTRGYAEMQRYAALKGAQPETLAGLSGFGDLTLTCSSEKSRNYSFGLTLGRGDPLPEGTTVEGRATAKAVSNLAQSAGIEMPIAQMVVAVLDNRLTIGQAVESLLSRPLKEE